MAISTADPTSPQRHERFWFADGNLILQVQNTLYHVHRFFFEIYASNFPLTELEFECTGTSTTPHVLDADITTLEFDRLLACLYPRALWVEETQNCEEWTSVLKLATKWRFESLRTRALSKIVETAASPVDKVVLGRQYDLPDLLLPGYVSLCQSTVPISYEDALRLGMQDVVDIYHIRHQLYGSDLAPVHYEEALAKVKAYASAEDQVGDPKDVEIAPPSDPNADFVVVSGARPTGEESNGGQVSSVSGEDSPPSEALPDASEHDGLEAALNKEHGQDDAYISTNGKEKNGEIRTPREDSVHSDENGSATPTDAGYDIVSEPRTRGDESDGDLITYNPGDNSSSLSGVPSDGTASDSGSASSTHSGTLPLSAGVEQYIDNLTTENFNSLSDQMMQRLNELNDSQMLLQSTRLVVTRGVEERGISELALRLCKKLMTETSNKIKDNVDGKMMTGPVLFREYLGQACRESLESASMKCRAAAGSNHEAEPRRLRLTEFVGELSSRELLTREVVRKIVTVLLADQHNEEKAITLCMLLQTIGASWDNDGGKRTRRMNGWFQDITTLAQDHSSSRARAALLDLIQLRQRGWSR